MRSRQGGPVAAQDAHLLAPPHPPGKPPRRPECPRPRPARPTRLSRHPRAPWPRARPPRRPHLPPVCRFLRRFRLRPRNPREIAGGRFSRSTQRRSAPLGARKADEWNRIGSVDSLLRRGRSCGGGGRRARRSRRSAWRWASMPHPSMGCSWCVAALRRGPGHAHGARSHSPIARRSPVESRAETRYAASRALLGGRHPP